jgi:hypothetical protein
LQLSLTAAARFTDQDLLLHPGHKHHFALRIFNLESLKASEFIQSILEPPLQLPA